MRLATLALSAVLMAPGVSWADSKPHAGQTIGVPAPGPVLTVGAGYENWNCQKGDCTNLTIQNVNAKTSREVLRIDVCKAGAYPGCTGALPKTIIVKDSVFTLLAPTKGNDLPVSVNIRAGDHIIVQNVEAHNFQMQGPTGGNFYSGNNGDGFSCERPATNVSFVDDKSFTNTDGGFDLKCQATLTRDYAIGNHRNFRFWGDQEVVGGITSVDPQDSHVWFAVGSNGRGDLLNASGSTGRPAFNFDGALGPMAGFDACHFDFSVPTKVFAGKVPADYKTRFGPSCQPDAKGYAINYVAPVVTPPVVVPPVVVKSDLTVCSKTKVPNGNGDATIAVKSATWLKALGLSKAADLIAAYQTTPACPFLYTVKP